MLCSLRLNLTTVLLEVLLHVKISVVLRVQRQHFFSPDKLHEKLLYVTAHLPLDQQKRSITRADLSDPDSYPVASLVRAVVYG